MSNQSITLKLWNFLKVRKSWWLWPLVILSIFVGILILSVLIWQGSEVLTAAYKPI